jgi:lambda family phage portal protein
MEILARVRAARDALLGRTAYAAARQPVGRAPWNAPRGGPNSAVLSGYETIAARARDAVRSNPYASRIVDIWVANAVGTGITTQWNAPATDALFTRWANSLECDAEGTSNWPGLQALATRGMVESGGALVWFRRVRATDDNPIGLALQVLESDRLDWTHNTMHDGRQVVQGIEVGATGRPVAFWLKPDLDQWPPVQRISADRVRVPAEDIIHLYRRRRPSQLRDVSWLAPVLWSLKDLTEYESALLRKAYVEACLALVVSDDEESDGTVTGGRLTDANGDTVEAIEPQMILYGNGRRRMETINPTGGGSHTGYAKRNLEAASVGTGLTYDQVSGDLSEANYSSLRAGKIEFRRLLEQVQYTILIPQLVERVARRFHAEAVAARLVPGGMPRPTHVPPAPEMIDPLKDTLALVAQVRAGFIPPQEAIGMFGSDFEAVLAQFVQANEKTDDAGLIFDTDPRRVAKSGGAHNPAQIAAIEIAATGAVTGPQE